MEIIIKTPKLPLSKRCQNEIILLAKNGVNINYVEFVFEFVAPEYINQRVINEARKIYNRVRLDLDPRF